MLDFYYLLRQNMIDTMQTSLKQIRQILGLGVQEFGDLMGLTRQTINNLETKKNKMSSIQYIAICTVIDNVTKEKPELVPILTTILCTNEHDANCIFQNLETGTLLRKWFLSFPDKSKIMSYDQHDSAIITNKEFEQIAMSYRVFLDQTVILDAGFHEELRFINPIMKNSQNKYIVPYKVIEAIQYQMMSGDEEKTRTAKEAMNVLMSLQHEDLLEVRGETSDVNIVSTLISVFTRFKCIHRLALITQDADLANQISELNHGEIGGYDILVLKYTKDHGIQPWMEYDPGNHETSELKTDHLLGNTEEKSISCLKGWETIN